MASVKATGPGMFPEPGLEADGGVQLPFVAVASQSCQEMNGMGTASCQESESPGGGQ